MSLRTRRQAPPGQIPTYDAYMSTLETHGHVDPDSLYYLLHSPGPKGFGAGITGWSNSRFDQLTEQASVSGKEEGAGHRVLVPQRGVGLSQQRLQRLGPGPGAGILTKRSFISEYVNSDGVGTKGDGNGGQGALVAGDDAGDGGSPVLLLVGAALVLGLGGYAIASRRPVTDDGDDD